MMKKYFCSNKNTALILFALLFILNAGISAQEEQPDVSKLFIGKWTTGARQENAIDFGGTPIRASLIIYELDGILYARMESPDADIFNATADDITIDGNKIKIYFKQLDGLYKGKLNDDKNQLIGTLVLTGKYISASFVKVRTD